MESELLKLLNETRGSLLEDTELFNTLQTSKATSEAVKKSLEISEKTEVQIDSAREVSCTFKKKVLQILHFRAIDLVRKERPYYSLC